MKKISLNLFLFFVIFVFSSISLYAQTQEDFQLWTEFSVSKKIKKIEFTIAEEFRFNQNISEIEQFYTDFGVGFKVNKFLDLGVNYRFSSNHIYIKQYKNSHRFNIDAKFNFKKKRLSSYFRIRYQTEINDFLYVPTDDFFSNKIRNKINLKYDIKKTNLTPFATFETFTDVDNTNYFNISKIRCTLGFGFNKKIFKGISIYFRLQQTYSLKMNQNDYIIGVGYNFDL